MTTLSQRLRQKLLDLAIRGKLVPQDAHDVPAAELLERIRNEELGMRNGRARRAATAEPISDDEKPFDLPKGWCWCRFRELGTLTGGHTPSMANPKYWNGDVLWVTSKDMKRKYIDDTGAKVTKLGAEELTMLEPGAILMCTRSGILRRTFPVAIAAKRLTINQDQRALSLALPEMSEYVYAALCALEPTILAEYRKTGTTVESIIWDKFIEMPIPLPPLAEQKRIVAALDGMLAAADAVAAGTEKIAALKEKARAKILDLAIRGKLVKQDCNDEPAAVLLARIRNEELGIRNGRARRSATAVPISDDEKPFDLPKGWCWCKLGEVIEVTNGFAFKSKDYAPDGRYTVVNIGCVQDNSFSDRKASHIANIPKDCPLECRLSVGDVLMSLTGNVGRVCRVTIDNGLLNQRVAKIASSSDCLEWFYCLAQSTFLHNVLISISAGCAQLNLSPVQMCQLPIPLPPLAEQKRIVAKVDEMLAACEKLGMGN